MHGNTKVKFSDAKQARDVYNHKKFHLTTFPEILISAQYLYLALINNWNLKVLFCHYKKYFHLELKVWPTI